MTKSRWRIAMWSRLYSTQPPLRIVRALPHPLRSAPRSGGALTLLVSGAVRPCKPRAPNAQTHRNPPRELSRVRCAISMAFPPMPAWYPPSAYRGISVLASRPASPNTQRKRSRAGPRLVNLAPVCSSSRTYGVVLPNFLGPQPMFATGRRPVGRSRVAARPKTHGFLGDMYVRHFNVLRRDDLSIGRCDSKSPLRAET